MNFEFYIRVLNAVALLVAVSFGMFFALRWERNNRRDRARREQQEKEQEERRRHEEESRRYQEAERRTAEEEASARKEAVASGGYLVVDLPEHQKPLFHDLLKGFEEYAQIRGYVIKFSVDNSVPHKIAFKFTLTEAGITVSTAQVRRDLAEYIEKVRRDDPLEDLPEVLPHDEHYALVLAMRNRINFLHHTYKAQTEVIRFYNRFLTSLPIQHLGGSPAHHFYLQGSGAMDQRTYSAINSPQTAQGDHNLITGNTVQIGSTTNERLAQIQLVEKFIEALQRQNPDLPEASQAVHVLGKVRDELADEENPDPSRIAKWLGQVKTLLGAVKVGQEVLEAGKAVGESFHLLT
jgi:hypothetical protein